MTMQDKLTFLVCSYFLPEVRAVVKEDIFNNMDVIAYKADCDQPIKELLNVDDRPLKIKPNTILMGSSCLKQLNSIAVNSCINVKDFCFELLLAPEVIQLYLDQGAHLFTPAMLDDWNKVNKNWKFTDDSDRNHFFSESTSKLVLIDAGLNSSAAVKMEKIANQLELPWEVKTISLDRLRWQLLQQISAWRLSQLSEKDKRLADYAMINELMSHLVTFLDEKKVIEQSLEMFHMFCATDKVYYLSIDEQENYLLYNSQAVNNQQEIIKQLKNQIEDYQLLSDGFQLLIKWEQKTLGIIAIKEVAFPQYTNHYLNLARNISPVIALAVNNARIYQKQLAAEQKIHNLNSELNTQLDSVNNLNKELESFTYSVSHDLRGPLRSLDGFSHILLRDYTKILDERGQGFLNRIRVNAQRMGQLIDDLLRLSRLTRAELIIKPIDLSEIAIELSEDLQLAEPQRQVKFIIAKDLKTKGDFSLIKAVMENLMGNSWKYTSKCDLAEIQIGQQIEQDQTVFYIKDNGAGFDMTHVDKLFAPFQRLHSDKDYPGTGIGLATVQRIIQRHSGIIWAESKPNKGADFYFSLGNVSLSKHPLR
jgi:signal transduction histidine kinase